MGFQDFISESEAASLSGVSVSTLRRFSEVGYLKLERDADGIPLFSKSELSAVFGTLTPTAAPISSAPVNAKPAAISRPQPSNSTSTSFFSTSTGDSSSSSSSAPGISSLFELLGKETRTAQTPQESGSSESSAGKSQKVVSLSNEMRPSKMASGGPTSTPPATQATNSGVSASLASPLQSLQQPIQTTIAEQPTSTALSSQVAYVQSSSTTSSPVDYVQSQVVAPQASPPPAETAQLAHLTAILDELRSENRKLRTVVDLQEKILTIREGEIRDLKEQRDWLKSRLERLEEKADRDQLLLLSETQTIRKLISMQETKKSTLRAALDWLGFAPEQPTGQSSGDSSTIEVRNSSAWPSDSRSKSQGSTEARGFSGTKTNSSREAA